MATKDTPATLLDYGKLPKAPSLTDPTIPTTGNSVAINFQLTKKNPEAVVNLEYIEIDLRPGDGADSFTTVDGALRGRITTGGAPHPQFWGSKAGAPPDQDAFPSPVPSSVFKVYPTRPGADGTDEFEPMQVSIIVDVNGIPGEAICRISEKSSQGSDNPPAPEVRIHEFRIAKYRVGSVFDNFAPVPPKDSLVKRGAPLHLGWRIKFPDYPGPPGSNPYYTVDINYEGKSVDVTTKEYFPAPEDTLTLSHITPFALNLKLYNANQQLENTYTLTTIANVADPNVNTGKLSVSGTANLLKEPQEITEGSYQTFTDGLLLCSPQGNSSGLYITISPPQGIPQYHLTSPGSGDPANYSTNILIPVAKGASITLAAVPANSTYQATWIPLGNAPGIATAGQQ